MEHKEIALQLTLKAMETGLIPKKDQRKFQLDYAEEEVAKVSAQMVNDFFQETLNRLNGK